MMALAPAMLSAPLGTEVEVIASPSASTTVPIVKLETVKSEEFCEEPMVYVPLRLVPAEGAVSNTVAPLSSVTVSVLPD